MIVLPIRRTASNNQFQGRRIAESHVTLLNSTCEIPVPSTRPSVVSKLERSHEKEPKLPSHVIFSSRTPLQPSHNERFVFLSFERVPRTYQRPAVTSPPALSGIDGTCSHTGILDGFRSPSLEVLAGGPKVGCIALPHHSSNSLGPFDHLPCRARLPPDARFTLHIRLQVVFKEDVYQQGTKSSEGRWRWKEVGI